MWANAVGRMTLIDLLHTGLLQTFKLLKENKNKNKKPKENKPKHKQKTHAISARRNKMRYDCISLRCVVCPLKKDSSSSLEINYHCSWKKWENSSEFFFFLLSSHSQDLVSINFLWLYSIILSILKLKSREPPCDNIQILVIKNTRIPFLLVTFLIILRSAKEKY